MSRSWKAIADAAGVSRQTVHRHFGAKDELTVAVTEWRGPREEAARAVEPGDVAAAVERVAIFRGKNDLETGSRKIAGLGLYVDDRGALLFHSSVLADLDVAFMLKVLRIPAAKLGDKAVAAVQERVTTGARETGEAWTGAALRDAIALGFQKEFGAMGVAAGWLGLDFLHPFTMAGAALWTVAFPAGAVLCAVVFPTTRSGGGRPCRQCGGSGRERGYLATGRNHVSVSRTVPERDRDRP